MTSPTLTVDRRAVLRRRIRWLVAATITDGQHDGHGEKDACGCAAGCTGPCCADENR